MIHLTSIFPGLRFLGISIITVCGETRGIASGEELPTAGNFQGYLCLSEQHEGFLVLLPSTSPRFNAIYIDSCEIGDGVGKLLDSSIPSLGSLEPYIEEDDLESELQDSQN